MKGFSWSSNFSNSEVPPTNQDMVNLLSTFSCLNIKAHIRFHQSHEKHMISRCFSLLLHIVKNVFYLISFQIRGTVQNQPHLSHLNNRKSTTQYFGFNICSNCWALSIPSNYLFYFIWWGWVWNGVKCKRTRRTILGSLLTVFYPLIWTEQLRLHEPYKGKKWAASLIMWHWEEVFEKQSFCKQARGIEHASILLKP